MKRVCLLACLVVLSGCVHAPPEQEKTAAPLPALKPEKRGISADLVEKSIVKGKTTREELIARLGTPNSVEKHPYHVPKVTDPNFKTKIPPELMAAETWLYWTPTQMAADNTPVRVLYVKIHLDEANVVIDYEMGEKDLKPPEL